MELGELFGFIALLCALTLVGLLLLRSQMRNNERKYAQDWQDHEPLIITAGNYAECIAPLVLPRCAVEELARNVCQLRVALAANDFQRLKSLLSVRQQLQRKYFRFDLVAGDAIEHLDRGDLTIDHDVFA